MFFSRGRPGGGHVMFFFAEARAMSCFFARQGEGAHFAMFYKGFWKQILPEIKNMTRPQPAGQIGQSEAPRGHVMFFFRGPARGGRVMFRHPNIR